MNDDKNSLSLSDKNLFLRLKKYQDRQAFLSAYDQYADAIYRFVFFKVGNQSEAEDLTSAVFLKCWGYVQDGKLKSADEYKSLKSFLYKIARNLVIDHYRQRRPLISLEEAEDLAIDFNQGDDLAKDMATEMILAKIKELKSEYRAILILKYVNDLSVTEIAEVLGKTKGNVRVTLFRALEALKNLTEDYEREGTVGTTE